MDHTSRRQWLGPVILAGVLYPVVGIASAALAEEAASQQMQFFWRLSAFGISGVLLAAHVAYEHFRLRDNARVTAWHASLGAAIGGFLLALMANIHDMGSASGYRPRMLIAFMAWPLLTSVPAFVVALVLAVVLGLKRRPQAN